MHNKLLFTTNIHYKYSLQIVTKNANISNFSQNCKEYCKIHGLTGCDWTPPDQSKELKSNCSAVLEGFGTHYMLPSDDGTQCYPLYSANRGKILGKIKLF